MRPDPMAVRAHDLALGDLFEDSSRAKARNPRWSTSASVVGGCDSPPVTTVIGVRSVTGGPAGSSGLAEFRGRWSRSSRATSRCSP
jgi:hypothetical protein